MAGRGDEVRGGRARRRGGLVALAAVALAIALVSAACIQEETFTGNPTGHTVALIGNQLTFQSRTAIHSTLDPTYQVKLSALSDSLIADQQTVGTTYATPAPEAIILEVGTGDVEKGTATAASLAQLDTLVAKYPTSCVIVVTLTEEGIGASPLVYNNTAAAAFNQGIYDRGLFYLDWNSATYGTGTQYRGADGITPTAEGQTLYAGLLESQLYTCFNTDPT